MPLIKIVPGPDCNNQTNHVCVQTAACATYKEEVLGKSPDLAATWLPDPAEVRGSPTRPRSLSDPSQPGGRGTELRH